MSTGIASLRETKRIFIASQDALFSDSLRALLEREPDFRVIGEAGSRSKTVECLRKAKPDLLLLDLALPRMSSFEVLREISDMALNVRTMIVLTELDWLKATEALKLGACGVVLKDTSSELLFKSIRTVLNGEYWISHECVPRLVDALQATAISVAKNGNGSHLSPREIQIVAAVMNGCANRDIAEEFSIAEQTVKNHLWSIFAKLGVKSRMELAGFALKRVRLREGAEDAKQQRRRRQKPS